MTFCFDIDGVIMNLVKGNDYSLSTPIKENVDFINELYKKGNEIILYTARGSATKIDWTELTKSQLENAGLNYHKLFFGKPAADYYIDDKLISIEELKTKFN